MTTHALQPRMLAGLSQIQVIVLDAAVATGIAGERARRLLENRQSVNPGALPYLLITAHNDEEEHTAREVAAQLHHLAKQVTIKRQGSRNPTIASALALHRQAFPQQIGDREKDALARLSCILWLARRGGKGKPQFIDAFTAGGETTCGRWTPIVAYRNAKGGVSLAGTRPKEIEARETPIRGFLRSNVVQGVCPVDCTFCYLRGVPGMSVKQVALNLEDMDAELKRLPAGSVVNHSELGGLVEMDPWFVSPLGSGSLVQTILDYSTERDVVSFFLTKGVYEPYLRLQDRLAHVAISLNAPEVSSVFEPGGATPQERLAGLHWAIESGARWHTIRFGPIIPVEGYQDYYRGLFEILADIMGEKLQRMTVDVLRFSERLPDLLRGIFPEEMVAPLLAEMESEVKSKKYRPSKERQLELYTWVRNLLEEFGMGHVQTTPCKADPLEAKEFFSKRVISSMPCACHISYQDVAAIRAATTERATQRAWLPMLGQ